MLYEVITVKKTPSNHHSLVTMDATGPIQPRFGFVIRIGARESFPGPQKPQGKAPDQSIGPPMGEFLIKKKPAVVV